MKISQTQPPPTTTHRHRHAQCSGVVVHSFFVVVAVARLLLLHFPSRSLGYYSLIDHHNNPPWCINYTEGQTTTTDRRGESKNAIDVDQPTYFGTTTCSVIAMKVLTEVIGRSARSNSLFLLVVRHGSWISSNHPQKPIVLVYQMRLSTCGKFIFWIQLHIYA